MDETFAGWAVAAVAVQGSRFYLRCFTVGTFHEDDAVAYAMSEVRKDYPNAEIYTATQIICGMEILDRQSRR